MEIERDIVKKLLEWKHSETRKPMLIQGARQVGKTWVMKKFGETHYSYMVYFNFESNMDLAKDFTRTKDPNRILDILRLYTEIPIVPEDTLIIFDEIQECPDALNSLKYFCEEKPAYHIMCAGSLLGVAIHSHKGFPVGKVDFLNMYPISFNEYLRAAAPKIWKYIEEMSNEDAIPAVVEGRMWEIYRKYQVCGGMPKAVVASLEDAGIERIRTEQRDILTSYYFDFSKHAPESEFPKIAAVWKSLPSQLAKENRKFIYKVVKPGARAREYEDALTWLQEAGLTYKIFCISRPGLPISAYDELNAFKIYLLDVGLLRELAEVPPTVFTSENSDFVEFKGALTENAVLQNILPVLHAMPRYWVSNGTAEVDFIIQNEMEIIPVEVKSAQNTSSKSLSVYIGKYNPATTVVVSAKSLSVKGNEDGSKIINLPLPMIGWLPKFL